MSVDSIVGDRPKLPGGANLDFDSHAYLVEHYNPSINGELPNFTLSQSFDLLLWLFEMLSRLVDRPTVMFNLIL